jgi:hypothetical protein
MDLASLIETSNAPVIDAIVRSLRSTTGIIPFVGAGMSAEFGAPMWGDFLELAAATDEDRAAVRRLVKGGKYEEAAQHLDAGPHRDRFRTLVTEKLDVAVPAAKRTTGPLSLLPLLTTGPVITTNFDRVLEAFYEAAGRPFGEDAWIAGRKATPILEAVQQNRHALIKLHGDVRDASTFTFTALEYDESYGSLERGTRGVLTQLGNVIYTNRPLLFLGCSLENDRTLAVLQQVAAQNPYLTHYAVLAAPTTAAGLEQRREALARAGIVPLWFTPGDFKQIAVLLDRLVERAATDDIGADDPQTFDSRQPEPVRVSTIARGIRPPPRPSAELTEPHVREVAGAAAQGHVSFFLGAAVHLNPLLGDPFYEELAERFKLPYSNRNRADVAELLNDPVRRPALSDAVAAMISGHVQSPWLVHKIVAALAQRLPDDPDRRLITFTTNYDDVLERTLSAAGVAYHLFLYQPDGPRAGRFLHRSSTGTLRAVVNPNGLYRLDDAAPVVVKLNGGLDPLREVRGRFAVASRDFVELACRIPAALPRVIRQALATRSLLFVGHGLREPDVREFARYARTQRGDKPAWAVQNRKENVDVAYWRDLCGVDIREADLGTYLMALHRTLKKDFGIET